MLNLSNIQPKTPREEVIEILAEGIYSLIIRGERPHLSKKTSQVVSDTMSKQEMTVDRQES